MDGEPNSNPLERLEEILRGLGPRPEVDQIREIFKEIQSPTRGRPARRDGLSFRIAREVADRSNRCSAKKRGAEIQTKMKVIYGEVADAQRTVRLRRSAITTLGTVTSPTSSPKARSNK